VKEMSAKKVYGFLTQAFIFSVIMLISDFIAEHLPFPMPASVIGLVLLFLALCLKIIKLEQVESLGTALTSLIGFLFVPAGISVMNSLGVMQQYGIQICLVIIVATIILLGVTGLFSQLILGITKDNKAKEEIKDVDMSEKTKKQGIA
jgi:holin-like protein